MTAAVTSKTTDEDGTKTIPLPDDEQDNEEDTKGDMPFPLVGADEAEGRLKFLIHGDPGVGKTFLCGTAADSPAMTPVLFVDTEGGTLTIRNKVDPEKLDIVRVTTYSDMVKLITWLRRGHKYKTIIIDSLTEMQKAIMAEILKVGAVKDNKDPDIPEQRDWGKNSERVRKIVRAFRDLPDVHVVFTTLSREVKDERTGVITIKPALPGQLANDVPGFIDIVGWVHVVVEETTKDKKKVKTLTRQVMFQPERNVIVKDRSDNLGIVMRNPTLGDIVDRIQAKKEDD